MKILNKVQDQRVSDYFKDGIPNQRYYDFIASIIEEDGYIDEALVSDYECMIMG
jgi:hypothetical protein